MLLYSSSSSSSSSSYYYCCQNNADDTATTTTRARNALCAWMAWPSRRADKETSSGDMGKPQQIH